ncbi:hypothetical protein ACFQE5_22400 [Pseudonocardia hispaniensis]|uniref:Uncharacterized protein n=1 Tax=Pseudonocardia hispaniensis TaxID=904933 RepID=A0ABW1J972_9PSEU
MSGPDVAYAATRCPDTVVEAERLLRDGMAAALSCSPSEIDVVVEPFLAGARLRGFWMPRTDRRAL